jgi:peptidoglycan/LPS O-acetylase OafA/YrhL
MFTLSHLDGLMLGAGLAALLHLGAEARSLRRAAAGLIAAGLALRAGVCLTGLGYEVRREVFYIASWSVVFAGVLGLSVLGGPRSALNRVLRNRVLVFFGTYSYGIYLVHQPMMHFFFDRFDFAGMSMLGCWIRTVVWGVPPTLALALVLYHGFEKRFLDLKHHFVAAGGPAVDAYATSVALSTSGRGVVSG